MDAGSVVGLVVVALVLAAPFLLARASPLRGVRRGGRPRHPFPVPTRSSNRPGFPDPSATDPLDLPPVQRRRRSRRRRP